MKLARAPAIAAVLFFAVSASHAESGAEELIARGAARLNAADLKHLLTGAEISGKTAMGFDLTWKLSQDGKIEGSASYSSTPIKGTWNINDNGQFCFDHESSMGRDAGCWDWFKLGADYFVTRGNDRATMKRTVSRK